MNSLKVEFAGSSGDPLAARLELPLGPIRSYAIFAHCFTCSKDLFASRRIASELAMRGIAVLRFDFTGLGASGGEFANSNFSSNVEDLRRAGDYLARHFGPAELLIGHSLGGAAVLAVAAELPEVRAVVAIGAPADTEHVIHNFRTHVPAIESHGEAEVELAGRRFTIRRQFLDDVRRQQLEAKIHNLGRPLLILHAPGDEIVGVENARQIFAAARHPKSFISLDSADHLLTRHEDATFVAEVVSAWFARYLPRPSSAEPAADHDSVLVRASGEGRFQHVVEAGRHRLLADEPESYGGLDSGPSPYDFVAAGLGACTSMTLQLYAERKGWQLPPFTVEVRHTKVYAEDCVNCEEGRNGKIDEFERRITFETDPGPAVTEKIAEIAGKCPVHRTLGAGSQIGTKVEPSKT
jgi:putative redox protein